jgi:colanic acid/amylovoran biosynthesis glycosyltransferase
MHIGYIISRYPAVSHTFVQREVLALRKLGWTVTTISIRKPHAHDLLTPADKSEAAQTHIIVPANPFRLLLAFLVPLVTTPIHFLRAWRTAWRLRRPGFRGTLWSCFYFFEALLVRRLAGKHAISHLHAHFANVASDVAMIAAALPIKNQKSKIENASTFSFTMHGPTEFFDVAQHRLAEKTRAAKFVICISDFARSQLMSFVPSNHWPKLHVVHCGIDPAQFQIENRKSKIENRINILTIARLAPVKGHPILFHAIGELLLRGQNIHLNLAGDGPSRRELEHLADSLGLASRITFLGNVGQDKIPALFADAGLFVLPSFAEGVPVVLMEAMAARCPVLATRIAGIPELIEDNLTGLLVSPGRADLLANAIERLLAAPRLADRMAAAAHAKILRDFNVHSTSSQLASIFNLYKAGDGYAVSAADSSTILGLRDRVDVDHVDRIQPDGLQSVGGRTPVVIPAREPVE